MPRTKNVTKKKTKITKNSTVSKKGNQKQKNNQKVNIKISVPSAGKGATVVGGSGSSIVPFPMPMMMPMTSTQPMMAQGVNQLADLENLRREVHRDIKDALIVNQAESIAKENPPDDHFKFLRPVTDIKHNKRYSAPQVDFVQNDILDRINPTTTVKKDESLKPLSSHPNKDTYYGFDPLAENDNVMLGSPSSSLHIVKTVPALTSSLPTSRSGRRSVEVSNKHSSLPTKLSDGLPDPKKKVRTNNRTNSINQIDYSRLQGETDGIKPLSISESTHKKLMALGDQITGKKKVGTSQRAPTSSEFFADLERMKNLLKPIKSVSMTGLVATPKSTRKSSTPFATPGTHFSDSGSSSLSLLIPGSGTYAKSSRGSMQQPNLGVSMSELVPFSGKKASSYPRTTQSTPNTKTSITLPTNAAATSSLGLAYMKTGLKEHENQLKLKAGDKKYRPNVIKKGEAVIHPLLKEKAYYLGGKKGGPNDIAFEILKQKGKR